MPKRIVLHASYRYNPGGGRGLVRAFRGQEINLSGAELKRAEELGAVGRPEELQQSVAVAVVEPLPPVVAPAVPAGQTALVSTQALMGQAVRDKLGLPAAATDSQVLAALEDALADQETTDPVSEVVDQQVAATSSTSAAADGEDVAEQDGGDQPVVEADQPAAAVQRPAQSAPKSAWEQYAVDTGTCTQEQAAAATKQWLVANTPIPGSG